MAAGLCYLGPGEGRKCVKVSCTGPWLLSLGAPTHAHRLVGPPGNLAAWPGGKPETPATSFPFPPPREGHLCLGASLRRSQERREQVPFIGGRLWAHPWACGVWRTQSVGAGRPGPSLASATSFLCGLRKRLHLSSLSTSSRLCALGWLLALLPPREPVLTTTCHSPRMQVGLCPSHSWEN